MHVLQRRTILAAILVAAGGAGVWTSSGLAQSRVAQPQIDQATSRTAASVRADAAADVASPAPAVDPALFLLEDISKRSLPNSSIFRRARPSFDRDGAWVSVRFRSEPSQAMLDALDKLGVDFVRDADKRVRRLGTVVPARISWSELETLSRRPEIARIEGLWQPSMEHPLEVTSEKVGASSARVSPGGEADGAQTTIALIDTGIDVLHPFFFHADAGFYGWIDTDQSGVFDPGVDAVDLDADGQAAHNETLRVLDATSVGDIAASEFDNDDGILQPQRDWLYADMNADRSRNVGVEAGFYEETPAYGEAIFVVDDVNQNRTLDPDEKLVRLGTSKIRKFVSGDTTYVRGENLIEAGTDLAADAFHGSGSAGILVGGQPPFHDRVGVAPAAELLVYGLGAQLVHEPTLPLTYLELSVADGADVVLHEWTNSFSQPLDGSTNFEAAMTAARDAGVVQVNPVGNLNLSGKHIQQELSPGGTASLGFEVGEGFENDGELLAYRSAFGSLQWRGAHSLQIALRSPSGERIELSEEPVFSATIAGLQFDATREVTSRGTSVVRFFLESADASTSIEEGEWSFEITGIEQSDTIYGRITDAYSNWRQGVGWSEASSGESTLAFPATADAAVGVGAYAARRPTEVEGGAQVGELRRFSGRGPRIDGAQGIDIAAPDDPFVPLAATSAVVQADWGRSWFTRFGGTSGASPHVAAGVALLRQKHPQWTPDELEARIFASARTEGLTPQPQVLPDEAWGHGKLDVYRALFDAQPSQNVSPIASLTVEVDDESVVFDASDSEDPDGDRLEYRFDLHYDGAWETDWTDEPRFVVSESVAPEGRSLVARVEVRDVHGAHHGALASRPLQTHRDVDAGGDASADAARTGLERPSDSGCTSAPRRGAPAPPYVLVALVFLWWSCRSARSTK